MLHCAIVVQGRLGPRLDGLIAGFDAAEAGEGQSVLTGTVDDASSLQPLLNRLADFGIELVRLTTSAVDEATTESRPAIADSDGAADR